MIAQRPCPTCGRQVDATAARCPNCGETLIPVNVSPTQNPFLHPNYASMTPSKSKVTAGLLGIFLGGLGVHHFYLGNTGLGILYLLFSWTFIPLVVGFIEGIVFIATNDADWIRRHPPRF
jgi:TM2 domain-containing membrane protein YozV/endogenous inhibitor of DNA gyrase (YacG/DUF329 family)